MREGGASKKKKKEDSKENKHFLRTCYALGIVIGVFTPIYHLIESLK